MILTKKEIQELRKSAKKAEILQQKAQQAAKELSLLITKFTGISGSVDYLQGDGFGFTPFCNDDTHIPLDILINLAVEGEDITEELILDNLSI